MRYSMLIIIAILIAQIGAAQSIQGIILDKETGEQLPFANVILIQDSIQIAGVSTSIDGEYSFDDIAPGTYDVEAVYVGYLNGRIGEVVVKEDTVKVDVIMKIDKNPDLSNVHFGTPYIPLIRRDERSIGVIQGKVFDEKTNEGLPFANVILLQEGIYIDGTTTDLEGNYIFKEIKPGKYDVEAVYVGYPNVRITGILIEDNTIPLDISMKEGEGKHSLDVHVIQVNIPIIRMDKTSTGTTWKANEIKRFPGF